MAQHFEHSISRINRIPRTIKILLVLGVFLMIIRAFLPMGVQWYLNRELSQMKDYKGHVGDVDLALIRGAVKLEHMKLVRTGGKVPVPFLAANPVEISIAWKELIRGSVVAEVDVGYGELNIVDGPTPKQSQKTIDRGWLQVLDKLLPIRVNRFTLRDGEMHFRNLTRKPAVDVHMKQIVMEARNLSNTADKNVVLPSTVKAHGIVMNKAPFKLQMKLNALKNPMDFDLNSEMKELSLPRLNNFFKAYADIDVENGTLSVATELASKDGKLKGYVKPIMKNLDVVELDEDTKKGPFALFWQSFTGTIADILQNNDKQGAKVPIEGTIIKPKTGTFAAVKSALGHAFGSPLSPGIERTVNISSPKNRAPAKEKD